MQQSNWLFSYVIVLSSPFFSTFCKICYSLVFRVDSKHDLLCLKVKPKVFEHGYNF